MIVVPLIPHCCNLAFIKSTNFFSLPATFSAKAIAELLALAIKEVSNSSSTVYFLASKGTLLASGLTVS